MQTKSTLLNEALRRKDQLLQLAEEASGLGFWAVEDYVQQIGTCSVAYYHLYGRPEQNTLPFSQDWYSWIHPDDRQHASEAIEWAIREGGSYRSQFRVIWPDHSIHWLESHGVVKISETLPTISMIGSVKDITEQMALKDIVTKARLALEDSRQHLSKLIELVPAGIFETDAQGSCTFVNETWVKLTGLTAEQVSGRGWIRAIHPDDRPRVAAAWNQSIQENRSFDHVYRFRKPDGTIISVHARTAVIHDDHGQILSVLCSVQDMTEQRKIQEELFKKSQEIDQFFNVTQDLHCITDRDGRFIRLNPAFRTVLGYSTAELMVSFLFDKIHPDDVPISKEQFTGLANGIHTVHFENRYRCKNGSYRILNWTASVDPASGKIYAAARDLTEMRKHESELRQTIEAINRSAIVALTDKQGKIISANDNFCKISGYRREELLGQNHRIVNSGDHSKDFFRQLWQTISSGQIWVGEIQNKKKDGQHYTVQTVISPLLDVTGQIDRYLAIRFDLTHHKESERLLEEAQRVAKIGSWSYNLSVDTILWSKQIFEILPARREQGAPNLEDLLAAIHPNDQARWREIVQKCLLQGNSFKTRVRSAITDRLIWIEASGEAKMDTYGRVISLSGTLQDITELVQAEERAEWERSKSLHNAKLASLGEISAGIAHEINNPLAIISGTIRALAKYANDPEKLKNKIEILDRAAERISKIVSGLRRFSRSFDRSEYKPHSIAGILAEACVLTVAKSKRHSTPVTIDCSTETLIFCDEIEIEQVLVNLTNNAIDAVKNLEERWVHIKIFEAENMVILQIRDSGKGIASEIQQKLFQPFFTTQPVGEGTGLGLSIVKGILDDHQAKIELLTEDSHTCFEIKFLKAEVKDHAI